MSSRFQVIREALGLNKITMAKELGIPQPTVSDMENGKLDISKKTIKKLISRYNVNANWLLTGEGEMFRSGKPEDEDDFPDDPMQGLAYLDSIVDVLVDKGVIDRKDIPAPLPGVHRATPKMTEETRRKLQKDLEKIRRESERIDAELKKYSDEASEPEEEYGPREKIPLYEPAAAEEEQESIRVPLVGRIAAGPPLDTERWPDEWVRILVRRGESPDTHYLLEAKGTSMNEANIPDDSLILVRRAERAESGQIVVVYLPDEGVTLKRISYNPEDRINLEWQDGSGRSRELSEEDLIQGVFVRVVRGL